MTVAEAVAWMRQVMTDQCRRECLAFWRERQGYEFVAQVEKALNTPGNRAKMERQLLRSIQNQRTSGR